MAARAHEVVPDRHWAQNGPLAGGNGGSSGGRDWDLSRRRRMARLHGMESIVLAVGSAAGLMAIDTVYALRGRISPVKGCPQRRCITLLAGGLSSGVHDLE